MRVVRDDERDRHGGGDAGRNRRHGRARARREDPGEEGAEEQVGDVRIAREAERDAGEERPARPPVSTRRTVPASRGRAAGAPGWASRAWAAEPATQPDRRPPGPPGPPPAGRRAGPPAGRARRLPPHAGPSRAAARPPRRGRGVCTPRAGGSMRRRGGGRPDSRPVLPACTAPRRSPALARSRRPCPTRAARGCREAPGGRRRRPRPPPPAANRGASRRFLPPARGRPRQGRPTFSTAGTAPARAARRARRLAGCAGRDGRRPPRAAAGPPP